MRGLVLWAGLIGLWPVTGSLAASPVSKAGPVRRVAPVRAKALAGIPREDGRPVKEDRGRIESRIAAARGQAQKGQYSEAVLSLTKSLAIEWAKDGISGKLYIVQARPETVKSQKGNVEQRDRKSVV